MCVPVCHRRSEICYWSPQTCGHTPPAQTEQWMHCCRVAEEDLQWINVISIIDSFWICNISCTSYLYTIQPVPFLVCTVSPQWFWCCRTCLHQVQKPHTTQSVKWQRETEREEEKHSKYFQILIIVKMFHSCHMQRVNWTNIMWDKCTTTEVLSLKFPDIFYGSFLKPQYNEYIPSRDKCCGRIHIPSPCPGSEVPWC